VLFFIVLPQHIVNFFWLAVRLVAGEGGASAWVAEPHYRSAPEGQGGLWTMKARPREFQLCL
jgi:hypothetical protein